MVRSVVTLFFGAVAFALPWIADAAFLSGLSDQISWSVPSATTTTHRIRFGAVNAIPPSGRILLYHDDGALDIPAGLDFTDIDLATGASSTGPFADRPLAGSADAANDGVAVTSGAIPGVSRILITLNSTTGISAGQFVEIEIGSNATFGSLGNSYLTNPATQGSYRVRIETQNAGGTPIDYGAVMYAIVAPVGLGPVDTTDVIPPVRSNGLPSGTLPGSTMNVEFSLNTDKFAYCRYATTSGIFYEAMTSSFAKTNSTLHTRVIPVAQNTAYAFYVRCAGVAQGAATNTDDYLISFDIGAVATASASSTPPPPPPPPVSSGGSGIGGGNFLAKADVTFTGSIFPLGPITLLKDNVVEWQFSSDVSGNFSVLRYGYERGPQSFSMYAVDTEGRRTSTYTGTIYLIASTNNLVGPVYLSPTIGVEKESVDPGAPVVVGGYAVPLLPVEVFMEGQGGGEGAIVRAFASSSATGVWKAEIPTGALARGTYQVKARTVVSERDQSIYSPLAYVGVGESPAPDFSLRADLNKDGKVNLIDFSILLFNWGAADPVADINQDGTVNLQDFSILVFYWTG